MFARINENVTFNCLMLLIIHRTLIIYRTFFGNIWALLQKCFIIKTLSRIIFQNSWRGNGFTFNLIWFSYSNFTKTKVNEHEYFYCIEMLIFGNGAFPTKLKRRNLAHGVCVGSTWRVCRQHMACVQNHMACV